MSVKLRVNALENFGSSKGCFLKKGKLIPAFSGVKMHADYPAGVRLASYSFSLNNFLFATEGEVFISHDLIRFLKVCDADVGSTPFLADDGRTQNRGASIIGNGVAVVFTSPVRKLQLEYGYSCGTVHCGRLFGADKSDGLTLRWSGTGGIDDAGSGLRASGYVKLSPERGKILNLSVYGGKLIAVREYGLTVLSAYGAPENFAVEFTDTDCDKIYKDTARAVWDKLYFYSASGLKCFDGSKISAVELRHCVSAPSASAVYAGRYYLAGTDEKLNRKVILCADLSDGESCIIDAPAETLFAKDGVYYSTGTSFYKITEGSEYGFESGAIDFGTGGLKTVTKIDVRGKADLRISNGVCTRVFTGACGSVRPHLRGRIFTVTANGVNPLDGVNLTAEAADGI